MICFAWSEFPQYAARCVGAFVRTAKERVVVVATRPKVPIKGMEALAGCEVIWLERDDARPLGELLGELPRVLLTSGWGTPLFNRYRDEVHASGGRVVAMSDNNFRFSLKEVVKAIRFRLLLRGKYEGFFVPGKACARLLRFYGVPAHMIRMGMYSADASIFNDGGVGICNRPKKIIYVGQFIERKNVRRLCQAFNAANVNGDWTLELYGSGPLKELLTQTIKQSNNQTILIHDFLQPEALAEKYRESRIFCLPSLEEHWGLVVHEAALSGCLLALSDRVGAAADFMGKHNGQFFDPYDQASMTRAFQSLMALSEDELRLAQQESIELGQTISLETFEEAVKGFVEFRV